MIIQETTAVSKLMDNLAAMPAALQEAASHATGGMNSALRQEVESNLSGAILHTKSGKLLGSVSDQQSDDDAASYGGISISDDVPYAAILEYGGQTKAHIIQMVQMKSLNFISNGVPVFPQKVNHPGSAIPQFGYMRAALAAMQDQIVDNFKQAITQALATTL